MSKLHREDCTPLVFLMLLVGALLIALTPSLVQAQHSSPGEGCRAVSKIEYNAAKGEYLLSTRSRVYIRTGRFWRRRFWQLEMWDPIGAPGTHGSDGYSSRSGLAKPNLDLTSNADIGNDNIQI